ncbi:MAG: sporulation integral membrane protein YtvI [Paenibacillaceae bacterium]
MIPFYKRYWKTAFDIGLIVLTVFLIMWTFSFLYRIATPIFLSFVIYWMIEPFARFLHKRRMKKSLATAISMLLFIIVILSLIAGAALIFIAQITNLVDKLPEYTKIVQEQIVLQTDYLTSKFDALPDDLSAKVTELGGTIARKTTFVIGWLLAHLLSMLSSLSTFVVNFIAAIILAYFLSVEIETWKRIAKEQTPSTFKKAGAFLRDNVLTGISGYLKAQLKLITLTFTLVFISLLALGINNAFSVSLLAAAVDVIPLLGVTAIFIPWIVYLFIVGQTTLAIWLTVVLVVILLVRQILEPKLVGDSLGVSAFTMLSFMIISLSLFGVAGLILSPILIILIKSLNDQGYFKRWIRRPADEYDSSHSIK